MRKMFELLGDATGCAAIVALLLAALLLPHGFWGL